MNAKMYIAILGEYSSHHLDDLIQKVLTHNEVEIDVFDFPVVGGIDTVEQHSERVFVHKYACPSFDLRASIHREQDYIRDMMYLGAKQYYLCKPNELKYTALFDSIETALKIYEVNYSLA